MELNITPHTLPSLPGYDQVVCKPTYHSYSLLYHTCLQAADDNVLRVMLEHVQATRWGYDQLMRVLEWSRPWPHSRMSLCWWLVCWSPDQPLTAPKETVRRHCFLFSFLIKWLKTTLTGPQLKQNYNKSLIVCQVHL